MWKAFTNFLKQAFTDEAAASTQDRGHYSVTSVTLNEHAAAHIFRKAGAPKAPLAADDIMIVDEDSVKAENWASMSENHFVTENDPDAERKAGAKTFEQSGRPALAVVFCNMGRFREKEADIASTLNRLTAPKAFYYPPAI